MSKNKQSKEVVVDFYNGNRIIRPNPHSVMRYDFDVRKKGEGVWKYLDSSDNLADFDEQVKVALEATDRGEYRILISETGEVIRTNVK